MRGSGSIGYRSCKTIHSSYCHCRDRIIFMKKKVLKCLWLRKVLDIGLLKTDTLPQVIGDVMKVKNIGLLEPATRPQVIAEVVDVGQV